MSEMSIGEFAKDTGVNVQTVRYYERRGLLATPARTRAGYRRFDDGSVRQVRFIKRAQSLGFTLKEIHELLTLRADPETTRTEVKARTEEKIKDITGKLRLLEAMKRALIELVETCDGRGDSHCLISHCPILNSLDSVEAS